MLEEGKILQVEKKCIYKYLNKNFFYLNPIIYSRYLLSRYILNNSISSLFFCQLSGFSFLSSIPRKRAKRRFAHSRHNA